MLRGGISSVMGNRYAESNDNTKKCYMDASKFFGHSISQSRPFDEVEMWHGHPDFYISNLGEITNASDDSDIGYFPEVCLNYPDNLKEITKISSFCPE